MPLSEHERRELAEIEQSLYDDDPGLEATAKSTDITAVIWKRLCAGIAIVVIGLAILITGVALPNVPVGVVGFLVMLAGGVPATQAIIARKRTRQRR